MSKSVSVSVKELPETVRTALASVEYSSRDITIEARETVSALSPGGQGQRGFVLLVNLDTGETERHQGSWGGASPSYTAQVDADCSSYPIKPGFAVIKGTTGYPRTFADMYLHPSNVVKLLPAVSSVTPRERIILQDFYHLTSSGRKNEWSAYPEKRPTAAELNSLISRKLLSRNKAGSMSITIEGKNASR